jgi:hypothetical protein
MTTCRPSDLLINDTSERRRLTVQRVDDGVDGSVMVGLPSAPDDSRMPRLLITMRPFLS